MADGGSGEKTEEPTPERLRKLRKDGNVAKSQDITSAVSFLVVFATLSFSFPMVSDKLIEFLLKCIAVAATMYGEHKETPVYALMTQGLITMGLVCGPVLAAAFVVGIGINVAQVGFLFTLKPITPDLNKINPINGLKGMFNMKKVVELLKTIIKFVLISYLSYLSLKKSLRDVTLILRSDLFVGVKIIGSIIADFVLKIAAAFIVIAAADVFYQRKRYTKDNMMTKYDIKQEYKQSEGDPHHKAERKRLHQEILQGGGGAAVKGADVVVRNPDHIAVALKYDKEKGSAPSVVAKGERIWAEKILDAARQYGVPVVRNVPLAQALNKLDVGDEIPEDLYKAVAEVLTFVYNLSEDQKKKATRGKKAK
jgi:flagellar biosynthetic protein FlhB